MNRSDEPFRRIGHNQYVVPKSEFNLHATSDLKPDVYVKIIKNLLRPAQMSLLSRMGKIDPPIIPTDNP